jgi:hypothetical protein
MAETPTAAVGASAAAEELLMTLSSEHKFALGGLCALLIGRHKKFWSDAYCTGHLQRLGSSMLKLPPEQCMALTPLSDDSAMVEPSAFVELLPKATQERAALLVGLLVLTVVSEDAQMAGYDARARQLLHELARELAVPWPTVCAMERQLAVSMRAQAAKQPAAAVESSSGRSRRGGVSTTRGSSVGVGGGDSGPSASSASASPSADAAGAAPAVSKKGVGIGQISSKWRKRLPVCSIGVASGVAIGLTAGLAAPMVVAGLSAVGAGISGLGGAGVALGATVSATAAMLSGAVGVTVVTTVRARPFALLARSARRNSGLQPRPSPLLGPCPTQSSRLPPPSPPSACF